MNVLDKIKSKLPNIETKTLVNSLGMMFTYADEQKILAEMDVDERTCQSYGILSGGANMAFAETLAGVGSVYHIDEDEQPCGIQVSANHMRMVPVGERVYAEATIVHKGRTTHVWNVDIKTSEGKMVTTARVVNLIIKRKKRDAILR